MSELTQAQKEAFERFKMLKVGALFMKMGSGKTRVAVQLVNYNEPDFLLYLTPCSTKANVTAELEKWGVNCPYKVVGYETISGSDRIYTELLAEMDKYQNAFIIADESIFIKNGRTKRFCRSRELREKCKYALILNGTPISKSEWDIYNQMNFLSDKIFNMSFSEFLDKFFVEHCIRKYGREICYHTFYEPNRPAFMKMVAPYSYYADLIFDREESENYCWIDSSGDYERERTAYIEDVLEKYVNLDTDTVIMIFGKLHYLAAMDYEKNKKVAKYINGKRLICFCMYQDEVNAIAQMTPCYVITGSTSQKERDRVLEEFKADSKPLLLTFGVGSYSLNLQFCSEIVYSSLTFNFGNLEQSMYRIKRMGQDHDIKYTYFLLNVGINDMIFKNIGSKENLARAVKRELENTDPRTFVEGLKTVA